jgi:tRNA modification GTPase
VIRGGVVVAAATPWGHGALAVVRLSGPQLAPIVGAIARPVGGGAVGPRPRFVHLYDGDDVFDDGMAWIQAGPATYTGEDVAEITCHGNPLLVRRLVRAAVDAGARMAEPGEFTRRAVLAGKLDLVRAEAVLQVASATSSDGLAVGRAALDGRLSSELQGFRAALRMATAELEARLDYPADELAKAPDAAVVGALTSTGKGAANLASSYEVGRVLVQGARVALVGAVNAGKSSLFNALLGRKRALVHETEGTTRDVLEQSTTLNGVEVTLLDTAGERVTTDPVEAAGQALGAELVADADLLVVVLRGRPEGPTDVELRILERTADRRRVVVLNGVDAEHVDVHADVRTVASEAVGIVELRDAISLALVGERPGGATLVIASEQQRDVLRAVSGLCEQAVAALDEAGAAVAADFGTEALEELATLLGGDVREEVLDALFSRFCIGK